LTLESDKASMEIPSPYPGLIIKSYIRVGDVVSKGSKLFDIETSPESSTAENKVEESQPEETITESKPSSIVAIQNPISIQLSRTMHQDLLMHHPQLEN
jgi:pyruvate/2-oxoglutarate dehydrogenase complex dihydrolipoamide acyltransferase (E2) component